MSNVIPFRKKPVFSKMEPDLKMKGCHFEGNGIAMLLGENVTVDMTDTKVINNGAGIIKGSIDDNILSIIAQSSKIERFKFATELDRISNIEDKNERKEEIQKTTIVKKLSTVANIATVTTWISDVVDGVSKVDFNDLLNMIIG